MVISQLSSPPVFPHPLRAGTFLRKSRLPPEVASESDRSGPSSLVMDQTTTISSAQIWRQVESDPWLSCYYSMVGPGHINPGPVSRIPSNSPVSTWLVRYKSNILSVLSPIPSYYSNL